MLGLDDKIVCVGSADVGTDVFVDCCCCGCCWLPFKMMTCSAIDFRLGAAAVVLSIRPLMMVVALVADDNDGACWVSSLFAWLGGCGGASISESSIRLVFVGSNCCCLFLIILNRINISF